MSLRIEEERAYHSVEDRGPGLSPLEQERVWERFSRVAEIVKQPSRNGVSLGLGLYICCMRIEQYGGQVGIVSAKGQGSTCWCTLPILKESAYNLFRSRVTFVIHSVGV